MPKFLKDSCIYINKMCFHNIHNIMKPNILSDHIYVVSSAHYQKQSLWNGYSFCTYLASTIKQTSHDSKQKVHSKNLMSAVPRSPETARLKINMSVFFIPGLPFVSCRNLRRSLSSLNPWLPRVCNTYGRLILLCSVMTARARAFTMSKIQGWKEHF